MPGGFSNPIVGGGGGLVYPSIHSPNFVHNSAGWSINKDGSAEFNNLVVRNGQIISGTALYYSGTPGAGTLVLAIAAANGSDSFGTNYYMGVTTYAPSGGASRVINLLSTAAATAGFFQYNNPSGGLQGALVLSVSSTGGIDPVTAHSYPAGLFGIDPAFGDTIQTVGAAIHLSQAVYTQSADVIAFSGAGANAPRLQVDSPEQTTASHAQMLLQGATPDGTTRPAQVLISAQSAGGAGVPATSAMLEVQGKIDATGTVNAIVGGAEETWHSLGTLAGYAVTVGLYRLTALGDLELDIVVVAGGANAQATTFSVTLPAAYRPANQKEIPAATSANIAAGVTQPRVIVTAAGAVTVQLAANSTATVYVSGIVPLN